MTKNNEPNRPATVPLEAIWNAQDNEWEIGTRNAEGKEIGEWKWWAAPSGHFVCHTFYTGQDSKNLTYTRFHPDGTISQEGIYVNGVMDSKYTCIRSENPTQEYFAKSAEAHVWKVISTYDKGFVIEEHYFNKEGKEVQEPYISELNRDDIEIPPVVLTFLKIEANITDMLWHKALATLEEIDASQLEDSYRRPDIQYLYYKGFCLYKQADEKITDEVIAICNELVKLNDFELWPVLNAHIILRKAFRFAYLILSKNEITNGNIDDALAFTDELIEMYSPSDDVDMFPFYAQKANLLISLDNKEEAYELAFYLEKNEEGHLIPEIVEDEDYQIFKKNNSAEENTTYTLSGKILFNETASINKQAFLNEMKKWGCKSEETITPTLLDGIKTKLFKSKTASNEDTTGFEALFESTFGDFTCICTIYQEPVAIDWEYIKEMADITANVETAYKWDDPYKSLKNHKTYIELSVTMENVGNVRKALSAHTIAIIAALRSTAAKGIYIDDLELLMTEEMYLSSGEGVLDYDSSLHQLWFNIIFKSTPEGNDAYTRGITLFGAWDLQVTGSKLSFNDIGKTLFNTAFYQLVYGGNLIPGETVGVSNSYSEGIPLSLVDAKYIDEECLEVDVDNVRTL